MLTPKSNTHLVHRSQPVVRILLHFFWRRGQQPSSKDCNSPKAWPKALTDAILSFWRLEVSFLAKQVPIQEEKNFPRLHLCIVCVIHRFLSQYRQVQWSLLIATIQNLEWKRGWWMMKKRSFKWLLHKVIIWNNRCWFLRTGLIILSLILVVTMWETVTEYPKLLTFQGSQKHPPMARKNRLVMNMHYCTVRVLLDKLSCSASKQLKQRAYMYPQVENSF